MGKGLTATVKRYEPEKDAMRSRFRFAVRAAAIAAGSMLCLAAGCATGGRQGAEAAAAAPVADAEWHSLAKSGRAAYLRNDFKGALPFFVAAAKRSRALDDPNGLSVALLDQARCFEELEIADILAARDKAAATGSLVVAEGAFMPERMRLRDELLALRSDPRLPVRRRAELDVAVAGLPHERSELAAIVERTPRDILSPADRARLLFACIDPLDPDDPAAACDLLKECPPDAELPPSLRARRQIMLILYCGAGELETLESAAAIYREAGRADGVAFALSGDMSPDTLSSDPGHAADMLLRGASACHALGYANLAADLLDTAVTIDDPAIRERAEALRASLRIPPIQDSSERKGDSQP